MAGDPLCREPKGKEIIASLVSRNSQAKGLQVIRLLEIPLREVTEGEDL